MTDRTRRKIERACTDIRYMGRQLENPDACTAKELEDMAHDLASISVELFDAARDIATDELAWKLGSAVEGIVE